ncbi:MAG: hypothetical protein M1482_02405 [Chloroflexi bacterium]|nr:hypothetical protein [Chloroflexota bacterium]
MKLDPSQYFDLDKYHARLERNRQAWRQFMAGRRSALTFINLCAPSLCTMFGVGFDEYYTDLATMADTQLRGIAWRMENLDEDELPQGVFLDQGTLHEAIAFNLPVRYQPNSPPWGGRWIDLPDEIDRLAPPSLVDHAALKQTRRRLEDLREIVSGVPVMASVHLHAPFTMAAQLIGAEQLYLLCIEEPERAHRLLEFCVRFFLHFERVKGQYDISAQPLDEFVCWRDAQCGTTRIWVSDDSAPSVSPEFYRTFVFPYNQLLFAQFDYVHLHMDGKWNHLVPEIARLKPDFVEVGGESDWSSAVEILGPHAILQGGVGGALALNGAPKQCADATANALAAAAGRARVVVTVAQEAHPGTPAENMHAIVDTVQNWPENARFRTREP